ncbi:MAG: sulfatase-like hydrolase/transferase [Phycisphaerae bacterium]|nr:sulfatase-like hydrolase/transferase [Tepidisphaeraceae bacterium]
MKTPTALCLAVLLLSPGTTRAAPDRAAKPNVLVIMSDEHNAGVIGCAGDAVARTPNLDALAARGVLFGAHYCSSPICTPSRQTFTTGRYVSRHNVWGNTVGVPETWPTLPKMMTAAGYDAYLIGKMHYKGGRSYGFDVLDRGGKGDPERATPAEAEPQPRLRKRLPPDEFRDNGDALGAEFSPLGESHDMGSFVDVGRRDSAIKFLRERKPGDKPFFLAVGFIAPHYPLVASPEDLAHYRGKVPMPEVPAGYVESLPRNYRALRNDRKLERVPPAVVRFAREAYYARVEWMDRQIGQVLDALKASGLADDTVVVYTSDHGENMGEHGLWWKNCMYDSAARVPLIVSWPARWRGGQRRGGACGSVDLVQTIAALGGARVPPDWDGSSMIPWLDDGSHAWKDQAVCEYYAGYINSGIAMIRQGRWKYVYHTRADGRHGPELELFDVGGDPKELRNVAADPAQADRLRQMHADLVKELGEDPERTEARYRAGAIPEVPGGVGLPRPASAP